MDIGQFQATSIALLRSAVGWQSAIARRLGVDSRTVRRWIKDGQVPDWVETKLAEMIGHPSRSATWPRDEWIVGVSTDGKRREYIVHTVAPRFIARIVACDEDGVPEAGEEPADLLSGTTYSADEMTVLCEIAWIDEVPPGQVVGLLEAAADAIEALDES